MKKSIPSLILYCFIFAFLYVGQLWGIAANITTLKGELNREFHKRADAPILLVSVIRTPISSTFTPLISHAEFEQFMKLLAASCMTPKPWWQRIWSGNSAATYDGYSRGNVRLNDSAEVRAIYNTSLQYIMDSVDSVRENIARYLLKGDLSTSCKLVVFNEMFFSQVSPLNLDQKNFIEEVLLNFSLNAENTVLYPNFLYTETRHVTGAEIHSGIVNMGQKSSAEGLQAVRDILPNSVGTATLINSTLNFYNAENTLKRCAQVIQNRQIPNDGTNIDWEYLVNETYSINNGQILTRYKKVGYYQESDTKISHGCIYDAGVGYDEPVVIGTNTLRDTLLRCISTDICLDLNLGIRRNGNHNWSNPLTNRSPGPSYLHIVQSNSINPFYDYNLSYPNLSFVNRNNLPRNTGILHVDKYPHPSWNIPSVVTRPQDIYLPYIDNTVNVVDDFLHNKTEFHLRIFESDYRFCFLEI